MRDLPTKRFIDHNGKLYIPIPGATNTSAQPVTTNGVTGDSMQLDDTKNKVYIHNLDEQLAEIDNEERSVFIPDIEKKLGKIPQYLLTGDMRPTAQNQIILYGIPASISVPEEQDNVRKAIIESRARAREKQLLDDQAAKARRDPVWAGSDYGKENGPSTNTQTLKASEEEDADAMDLG